MAQINSSIVLSTVTIPSIAFSSSFYQAITPARNDFNTITYENDNSNILETTFTLNTDKEEIELFVRDFLGDKPVISVSKYADDPEFFYITLKNTSKTVAENFKDADLLNEKAVASNLNYIFLVGE